MTRSRLVAGLAAVALAAATLVAAAGPASAAARVTVANSSGRAQASTGSSTTVTVSGRGFQSVEGGFGGIYVFFGWVENPGSGAWRPSRGGITGQDYLYVPDSESKDNKGYQRFVAFHGSDTGSAANGGEIAADGSWRTSLTIPGPTFQAVDRSGKMRTVDCATVTCGVMTFGAHGVTNKNNETFTKVTFVGAGGTAAPTKGAAAPSAGATAPAPTAGATAPAPGPTSSAAPAPGAGTPAGEAAAGDASAPPPAAPATLGLAQTSVVVGRVLSFTGQGFTPGEQVVGTLGAGLAAVGPLTAGAHGEVAGVVQLPADLRPGTQAFSLAGAASQQTAAAEFQAIADPVAAAAAANAAGAAEPGTSPIAVGVGVLALVLLGLLVSSFVSARRRRRRPVVAA